MANRTAQEALNYLIDQVLTNLDVEIKASGQQLEAAGAVALGPFENLHHKGVLLRLDVTASAGDTETLDVKVQFQDPVTGDWVDLGIAFTQATGVTSQFITIYPSADADLTLPLPRDWRLLATVGSAAADGDFTYSVSGVLLP